MIKVTLKKKPKDTSPENTKHYCLRKKAFPNQEDAKDAAKRYHKRFGPRMNVYECYFCSHWHIGTDRTKAFKRGIIKT